MVMAPNNSGLDPFTCDMQVMLVFSGVPGKAKTGRRSGCPVSIALEILGDRWTLLIIRDLMVRGYTTFKQLEDSDERIATNILTDRLRRLGKNGMILAEPDAKDRRRTSYRLTEKGMDLAPVLLELLIWGAQHERTMAPAALIAQMERNREGVVREARRRWRERDSTPMLPSFADHAKRRRAKVR
jgi:DNA-binding HxlR family transcriptional regulator